MIRVAFLDDLPAVRAGLEAIVALEPDLVSVGVAGDADELHPLLRRTRPDVVVLDLDHPGEDGLQLTLRLKRDIPAPRVVLYSSRVSTSVEVAAAAAGADAVVGKGEDRLALLGAIRGAAPTPRAAIERRPNDLTLAAERLEPTDRAILAMRLAATPAADIAAAVGISARDVRRRVAALVARLAQPARALPAHPA